MFRIKGAPFRHSGAINVSDCETAEDVIVKAGLDWNVAKCELVAKMPPAHTSDEMERVISFTGEQNMQMLTIFTLPIVLTLIILWGLLKENILLFKILKHLSSLMMLLVLIKLFGKQLVALIKVEECL